MPLTSNFCCDYYDSTRGTFQKIFKNYLKKFNVEALTCIKSLEKYSSSKVSKTVLKFSTTSVLELGVNSLVSVY